MAVDFDNNSYLPSTDADLGQGSWFVLVNGAQRGPFPLVEIQNQLRENVLSETTLAWCEGLVEWQPLGGIAFSEMPDAQTWGNLQTLVENSPSLNAVDAIELQEAIEAELPERLVFASGGHLAELREFNFAQSPETVAPRKTWALRIGFGAVVALAFAALIIANFWTRTVPELWNVSTTEKFELNAALSRSPFRGGYAAALAKANGERPAFYVAANLPDDSKLEFVLEGASETLVDRFHAGSRATLNVRDGLAEISIGQELTEGTYRLTLKCVHCPSVVQGSVLAQKTYFLGAAQDAAYWLRLKTYHARLREQARAELVELKQVADTLEHQLTESNQMFRKISMSKNSKTRVREWTAFHQTWLDLELELNLMTQGWAGPTLDERFYYASLYAISKSVSDLVLRIHKSQNELLSAGKNIAANDSDILENTAIAQSGLLTLRTKAVLLERAAAKATDMPARLDHLN